MNDSPLETTSLPEVPPAAPADGPPETAAEVQPVVELARRIQAETARVLVGLEEEISLALCAALAGGHVLIEGPPGVAKTLLVRTLAEALGGSFARIQFTPDLMPSDVTGTSLFHPGAGEFRFRAGPVFAQFVLCDEINRASAKTQSALLEAMQEGAVTIDGLRHELPRPFLVFATMNPIEHEGTYPLPEAQLDRFLFKLVVGYPEPDVEARLLAAAHQHSPSATPAELGVRAVDSPDELLRARALAEGVRVREDLPAYVVRLFAETRRSPSLALGASPRAGVMLLRAAKAHAALEGRDYVTPDHIKEIFLPVLRHRVALDPAEEIEGVRADDVLLAILDSVEVPR
jgi:MoxR-like ATPase